MNTILMTETDHKRIHQSIKTARENGNIKKEDFEKLLAELKSAKIVLSEEIPADVVTMNSEVIVHFENNPAKVQFKIVYPADANMKEKKISIFSPVAAALIGYRVNDEIDWLVPSGLTKIIIDEIIYQPEAAGDFHI